MMYNIFAWMNLKVKMIIRGLLRGKEKLLSLILILVRGIRWEGLIRTLKGNFCKLIFRLKI